jgi:hypothetical protein
MYRPDAKPAYQSNKAYAWHLSPWPMTTRVEADRSSASPPRLNSRLCFSSFSTRVTRDWRSEVEVAIASSPSAEVGLRD